MSILDGRNFDGIVLKCGETSGDADTLIFKDGRFRSSACDPYGYGDGAYTATRSGETIAFEAETESAAVRQAALEGHGARAAPRRHDDDGARRPGRGREVGPGRGEELSGSRALTESEADMSTSTPTPPIPRTTRACGSCRTAATPACSPTGSTRSSRAPPSPPTIARSSRAARSSSSRRPMPRDDPDCSYKGGAPGFVRVTGRRRAGVSELRRQRHVPQPRQRPRQPGGGVAVHRLRAAQPPARQRLRARRGRRSAAGGVSRARSSSCACTRRASFRTARATSTA